MSHATVSSPSLAAPGLRAAAAWMLLSVTAALLGPVPALGQTYEEFTANAWRGFDFRPSGIDPRNGPHEYLGERVTDWIAHNQGLGRTLNCREASQRLAVCEYTALGEITDAVGTDELDGTPLYVAVVFRDSTAVNVIARFASFILESENTPSLDSGYRQVLTSRYGPPRDSSALTNSFLIWRTPGSIVTREAAPNTRNPIVTWTWAALPPVRPPATRGRRSPQRPRV